VAIFCVPFAVMIVGGRISLRHLGDALQIAWLFKSPLDLNFALRDAVPSIRLAALLEWLVLAGAALVLLALRLAGRLQAPAFVALAVALVAADLFKIGMGQNPAIPEGHARAPDPRAASPREAGGCG
jgi:hypothetical protein